MDTSMQPPSSAGVKQQVAIVTGGGQPLGEDPSIGFAIVATLAAAGATVVPFDKDAEAAQRAADWIAERGYQGACFTGDVRSSVDCEAVVRFAVERFGGLNVLVNNVATLGASPTLDGNIDDVVETLDINLVGPIRLIRAAFPYMGRGGSIVNISSLGAMRSWRRLDYAASKGGLLSLTTDLAVQLGPSGIRINAVCPGQAWTPMGRRRLVDLGRTETEVAQARVARAHLSPLKTEGTGWDVAAAVLFLASDGARWITGQALIVDGGQSCLPPGVEV